MSRPLPPLNALRAFEAVARHLSFKRAAEELFVTSAALSHQIKDLEATLGHPLFERKMRSIALTPAGEALYPGLHVAFLQIRQSVEFIGKATDNNILVVSTPPGFTSKWLAPRLYRFLETNPDIDVRISATLSFANFTTDGVDIAIRNSRRSTQGLWARPLLPVSLVPVASPRFVVEKGLKTPADLANVPLLHDDMLGSPRGVPSWSDWLAAAGVADVNLARGLRFSSPDHAVDAAVEGAGVLLAHSVLAYDDLRTGRLVAPFDLWLKTDHTFQLVCPESNATHPKVRAFITWIFKEVERMELSPGA